MPTSYTTLLGLALPVQGELSGTWGDTVNDYITKYLDAAVAGTQTVSGSQTAVTLSKTTNASLSQAGSGATGSSQYAVINCTGNPASLLTITAPAESKEYIVINATSTSQSVKIVGAGPTTGVTVVAGERCLIAWNGADFVKIGGTGGAGDFTTVDTTNLEVTNVKAKDGTAAATIADSTGVVSFSANPVLSGGTANGVAYLNASKVLTTGSALTFDGTNFATTGTATATKLVPTGNVTAGNGMYLPTTNTLAFSTNGSERVRIDSSGNVGIGTTTLTQAKVVIKQDTQNFTLDLLGQNASNAATVRFISTNYGSEQAALQSISGGGLITYTNGTERARIDSSGNVGIGTSSPTAPLDVNGNVAITGSARRITGDFSNATVANRVMFQTSTVNGVTRVGVIPNGTSQISALDLHSTSDLANYQRLTFGMVGGSDGRIGVDQIGTGTYLPMTFYTGGSERVRIDTSGNVGIGTSSPSYTLQIVGSLGYAATNQYTDDSLGGGFITAKSRGTTSSPSAVLTGDSLGLFSAGGYNSSSIVYNKAAIQMVAAENWTTTANGSYMTFATTANGATSRSERARITSGGEVYIAGTTDQGAYNLQVNGTGVWGAGAYVNGSDARLKENVQTLTDGLSVVTQLRPVTFQYKADYSKDTAVQPGFIAQELQQAMAGKDYVDGVVQAGPEHLNVAYQSLIPVLTKAIQELNAKVEALTAEIQTLKGN